MPQKYLIAIGKTNEQWRYRLSEAKTLREAKKIAESYGNTADYAHVFLRGSKTIVALYKRDPNADGIRWYKAVI